MIQRGDEKRTIYSRCELYDAGPPLLKVAIEFLDLLLDTAAWEGEPFVIQRVIPEPVGKDRYKNR